MRTLSLVLATSLLALGGGCGGNRDRGGTDGGTGNPDGSTAQEVTIQQVQSQAMAVGTPVTLRNVVVTAIDTYGGRVGGIYVEEADGGPFSGVFVYLKGTEAAGLNPGDLVNVEGGVKDEFALSTDQTGRTVTEISAPQNGAITVTAVGTGTVPAPEKVNPWDLYNSDDEAEKWEGVLIEFDDARVFSAPRSVSKSDATLVSMDVTGPFPVESSLTELADTIQSGDCYTKIVGVEDYFFNYQLLPRSADDLVTGADGDCLPPEAGDTLCADTMDNDHNGFTDCEDNGCLSATVACPATNTTVTDIQNGTVAPDTRVNLTGVTVTGVSTARSTFWVEDGTTAGQFNGVAVYAPNDPALANMNIGDTLDLAATTSEYSCSSGNCADHTLTELLNPSLSNLTAAGGSPTPVSGVSIATLASETDEEPYEGVLVTVTNAKVVNPDLGFGEFSIGTAAAPLIVDDDIYAFTPVANQCLGSITGIMHRNTFDGPITFLPRQVSDVVTTGGTCP